MKRNWTGRLLAAALALALSLSLAVSAAAEGVWPAGQSYEQDTAQEKVYAVRAESDGEDAEALRDRLLEAGFDAYLYRSSGRVGVLCGKFRDAEDALAYKTELADALEDVNLYAARAWLPAEAVDAFEAGPQEEATAAQETPAASAQPKVTRKTSSWQDTEGQSVYTVALSASQDRSYADRLVTRMQAKGFDAFVVEENGLYQVMSGKFRDICNALLYRDCIWSNTDRKDPYVTTVAVPEDEILAFTESYEKNGLPGAIRDGLEEPTGPFYRERNGETLAFTVQLAGGTSFGGAERTRDAMTAAGYPSFVYESSRVYMIMTGAFANEADAEALLEDIWMNTGRSDAYVTRAWLPASIVK